VGGHLPGIHFPAIAFGGLKQALARSAQAKHTQSMLVLKLLRIHADSFRLRSEYQIPASAAQQVGNRIASRSSPKRSRSNHG